MEIVIGIVVSGALTWFFAHIYHKKSLNQQEDTIETQIQNLTNALAEPNQADDALLKQKRIEDSITEYKRAGTPVRVIDSYTDLSNEEKAELLDTVLLRVRGRKAKKNQYRALM